MFKYVIFLSLFCLIINQPTIRYPISFTVVRALRQPLTLQLFFNNTGCCQSDPNSNIQTSYNMVSLDGFSSFSTTGSVQTDASPLSIWMNAFLAVTGGRDSIAGNTTSIVQQHILDRYRQSSSQLLFNALSNQAPISTTNISATLLAQNIASFLRASQLDGVSIEFSDYHAVAKGTASNWLNTLFSTLRSQISKKTIVLIIPPTFVSRIPLFSSSRINSFVDFFVLKYYDTNQADYNTYQSLFLRSSKYPGSAFMQIMRNPQVWMDTCRTLIAKPTSGNSDRTSGGFMDSDTLRLAFSQFNTNTSWFGGFANLDFLGDSNLQFQRSVLQDIRSICYTEGNCICK